MLRHVSGVLRNSEIASEMHISLYTVKAHLKNIYRKLATTHRGDAVRRARQLGVMSFGPLIPVAYSRAIMTCRLAFEWVSS